MNPSRHPVFLIISLSILLASTFTLAGNVIVRNGQLNVSAGIYSDSDTLYVDSENDMVGIGTTTPVEKLQIDNGDIYISESGDTYRHFSIERSGSVVGSISTANGRFTLGAANNKDMMLQDDSGNGLMIKDGGKIGIGTTNPGTELHISSSGDAHLWFTRDDDNSEGAIANVSIQYDAGTYGLEFRVNGTTSSETRFFIGDNGYVGIGTTTPQGVLDIENVPANVSPLVLHRTSGAPSIQERNAYFIADSNGTAAALNYYADDDVLLAYGGGKVGIGTTSPDRPLHIKNNGPYVLFEESDQSNKEWMIGLSGQDLLFLEDATTIRALFEIGGDVGIGTTNPNHKLEVNGSIFAGGTGSYTKGYSVSTGTNVDVEWREGTTDLDSEYSYRFTLVTQNTGTDTGAVYVVWYDEPSTNWTSRMVSRRDSSSNHPLLTIDTVNGRAQVYHNHASTYWIRATVEYTYTYEPDRSVHVFGAESMWQRDADDIYYNDGDVGIGTSTPATKLHVYGEGDTFQVSDGSDTGVIIDPWANTDNNVNFDPVTSGGGFYFGRDTSLDKLIIQSGNLGIGTTTPELKLDVEGDIEIGTGTTGCVRDSDNTTIAGTCSSDIRLKTDIETLENVLENVSRLRPVTFKWIGGNVTEYGLIAQEAREVMPELVSEDDEGYLRVSYDSKLFMLMLESIRELKEENAALKAEKDGEISELRAVLCMDHPEAEFCNTGEGGEET